MNSGLKGKRIMLNLLTGYSSIAEEDPYKAYLKYIKDTAFRLENRLNMDTDSVRIMNEGMGWNLSAKDWEDLSFHENRLITICDASNQNYNPDSGYWLKWSRDVYREIAREVGWSERRIKSAENNSAMLKKQINEFGSANLKNFCSKKNIEIIFRYDTPEKFNEAVTYYEYEINNLNKY